MKHLLPLLVLSVLASTAQAQVCDSCLNTSAACRADYMDCFVYQEQLRQEENDCAKVIVNLGSNFVSLPVMDELQARLFLHETIMGWHDEAECQAHVAACSTGTFQVWTLLGQCYQALTKTLIGR